eukprot:300083-Rhodomonas_salina.1
MPVPVTLCKSAVVPELETASIREAAPGAASAGTLDASSVQTPASAPDPLLTPKGARGPPAVQGRRRQRLRGRKHTEAGPAAHTLKMDTEEAGTVEAATVAMGASRKGSLGNKEQWVDAEQAEMMRTEGTQWHLRMLIKVQLRVCWRSWNVHEWHGEQRAPLGEPVRQLPGLPVLHPDMTHALKPV